MATLGAFFDANVLYPSGLRNFLMHLALTGMFRAHWSAKVHEEWIRNLLKNRPDLSRDKLERTRHLMDKAIPHALVTGYESLIESLELPDRDDRHVLAAAIHCGASVIVTLNLADFPGHALRNFRIEARHPDDLVMALLETFPDLVLEAVRTHRASLKNPPKTQDEYLAELDAQGLAKSASEIRGLISRWVFRPVGGTRLLLSDTVCRIDRQCTERLSEIGQVVQHGLNLRPHFVVEVVLDMSNGAAEFSANHQAGLFELSEILSQHLL